MFRIEPKLVQIGKLLTNFQSELNFKKKKSLKRFLLNYANF